MSLIKDIRYNISRTCEYDPAVHSRLEVLLLYPHIKALIFLIGIGSIICIFWQDAIPIWQEDGPESKYIPAQRSAKA